MTDHGESYEKPLARAVEYARSWLGSLDDRRVGPQASADELAAAFGAHLPDDPSAAEDVVDLLAAVAEPGLMAMPSGRFFGWVIGGTLPAALAADWLVSAWDQNTGLRYASPATAAVEEVAAAWLLDLFGLSTDADVGFVTGATMANFTCLAAARSAVLSRVGWDLALNGLAGGPPVRVLVGAERHETVDLAVRYLGLGSPTLVPADEQGRIRVDALAAALAELDPTDPVIVCLQAGNVHSGAFDPLAEAIDVAHRHGAWVHVDAAFGLWAAASPALRHLVAALVERLARHARAIADGISEIDGARVVNEVDYTQVCVAFGDDERTRAVTARIIADGTVWMSGSRWRGQDVLRISVSNWSTDDDDVRRAIDAVRRAVNG